MARIRLAALGIVLALGSASVARAEGPYGERPAPAPNLYERIVDLVLVRPLALVPLVVAPVGCAVGLPVAWVMRSPVEEVDLCVTGPVRHVFGRPLGEL